MAQPFKRIDLHLFSNGKEAVYRSRTFRGVNITYNPDDLNLQFDHNFHIFAWRMLDTYFRNFLRRTRNSVTFGVAARQLRGFLAANRNRL